MSNKITAKRILSILLSTISSVVLIGILVVVILFNAIIPLPNIVYNNSKSTVEISTISEHAVCFSTPKLDTDVSNDEDFGARQSETLSNSTISLIGDVKNENVKLTSLDKNDKTQSADVENDAENQSQVLTANSNASNAEVLDANIDRTDEIPYAIDGIKENYTPDGDLRGLAVSKCVNPRNDFWFIGGDTHIEGVTNLILANTGATAAQIKLSVWGNNIDDGLSDDGSLKYGASRYVGVDAHSETSVLLSAGAPGQDVIAVHIEANLTPVAATIVTRKISGLTPQGIEYVNATDLTSNEAVIPGFTVSSGENTIQNTLSILSPTIEGDAKISAKFMPSDTSKEAVTKEFTLRKSEILNSKIDFLEDGLYTVILTAENSFLATIQQVFPSENGASEIRFLEPTALGKDALASIGKREDVKIYAYLAPKEITNENKNAKSEPIKYTLQGFDEKGQSVFSKQVELSPGEVKVFDRASLPGAAIINFMQATSESENNIAVQTTWNSANAFSAIPGSPTRTQKSAYNFTAFSDLR